MNEEQIKALAEQIKANLSIEELDELEKQYNAMLKELKEKESGSNGDK